jgi:hypothetical protein
MSGSGLEGYNHEASRGKRRMNIMNGVTDTFYHRNQRLTAIWSRKNECLKINKNTLYLYVIIFPCIELTTLRNTIGGGKDYETIYDYASDKRDAKAVVQHCSGHAEPDGTTAAPGHEAASRTR